VGRCSTRSCLWPCPPTAFQRTPAGRSTRCRGSVVEGVDPLGNPPSPSNGPARRLRNHLVSSPVAKWAQAAGRLSRALRIPFRDQSSRVWVMDAPGGRGPLRHSHLADEWTVVASGRGFTDETGHLRRRGLRLYGQRR